MGELDWVLGILSNSSYFLAKGEKEHHHLDFLATEPTCWSCWHHPTTTKKNNQKTKTFWGLTICLSKETKAQPLTSRSWWPECHEAGGAIAEGQGEGPWWIGCVKKSSFGWCQVTLFSVGFIGLLGFVWSFTGFYRVLLEASYLTHFFNPTPFGKDNELFQSELDIFHGQHSDG